MRLFRGMAVPASKADSVVSAIKVEGLASGQGGREFDFNHPGPLDALFLKDNLSTEDTRSDDRQFAVCACGDEIGAAYYAWRHNHSSDNNTAVMVEFEADDRSIAVDGRDFLYTVFQLGEPALARPVLDRVFGHSLLRYAEKAWRSEAHPDRFV